jgi:tripartite-type tricarboxylate transporter receptor subunit TctC
MTRNLVLALGLACGLGTLATGQHAAAQSAEEAYFKGKAIKMIVGYGPGGGYDAYARMLAPSLSKAIGGTVVVENQPGAGGLTALDRIYTAPPDGLQLIIVNGASASLSQLLGESAVRYDLAKIGYLATVASSPWLWLVNPGSPWKSVPDAVQAHAKIRWSAVGPVDGLSDGAAFTCEALKLDCQVIMGYGASNEAAAAVAKGEMDSLYVSDTSANSYVKSGATRAIGVMGRKRSRFFPEITTVFEQMQLTPEQAWWFDLHSSIENLGRILCVPPDMPADRLAFLQAAVKKMLGDPGLIADGERTQRYIDFVGPEETRAAAIKVVSSVTPEQKQRIKQIIAKDR